jgi:hypothetical protein
MSVPAAPVPWPNGARCAASFSFDVDAESAMLGVSTKHASRMSAISHQAYGPVTGVPRLLEILARHGITSTFFMPGYTAVRYPDVIRAIVDAGHEIAHHGYLHEPMFGLTEDQEATILDRGLKALDAAAGVRPTGYRAPMWELNWHSPKLLRDRGFLYDSSLMDTDHPYELAVDGGGPLVEIPIQRALDDFEQYCYLDVQCGEWTKPQVAHHKPHQCERKGRRRGPSQMLPTAHLPPHQPAVRPRREGPQQQ